ncbi:HEAT repeat domain-containing protein [Methanoplanus endosymbiosus]|uniref:HEAT repeat domain-containing protein n=1 Tax=Methanoplanus endosymbiosus TaxID=33865 RepID=A0A9E7PP11_9EURY|nr:HEAT repeat domain-containing protein [Methanoplanus endosymbiosus]UUX93758.1 HEAT repeat domain-containing protein [Methanoplanus endosymbiosus]
MNKKDYYRKFTAGRHSDFIKVYVIILYFIVIAILGFYSFSSSKTDESAYIIARMTPHLIYIPLVLTALWYPRHRTVQFLILLVVFVSVLFSFIFYGPGIDAMFVVFTSVIYLWVFFAILKIPGYSGVADEKDSTVKSLSSQSSPDACITASGSPDLSVREEESFPATGISVQTGTSVSAGSAGYPAGQEKGLISPCAGADLSAQAIPPEQIMPLIESFRINERDILVNTESAILAIGRPAEEFLVQALESNDSIPVRENSAKMLGIIGSPDNICALIDSLSDRSRRVHNSAVQALARIGEPAVAPLIDSLVDGRWKIRAGCITSLRIIGVSESLRYIIPLLEDENHYVRRESAKTVGRLGDGRYAESLTPLLNDSVRGVRLAAAGALGKTSGNETVKALSERLFNEDDPQVKERIVESLGLIGTEDAMAEIQKAVDKSPHEMRKKLIEAAGEEFAHYRKIYGFN